VHHAVAETAWAAVEFSTRYAASGRPGRRRKESSRRIREWTDMLLVRARHMLGGRAIRRRRAARRMRKHYASEHESIFILWSVVLLQFVFSAGALAVGPVCVLRAGSLAWDYTRRRMGGR